MPRMSSSTFSDVLGPCWAIPSTLIIAQSKDPPILLNDSDNDDENNFFENNFEDHFKFQFKEPDKEYARVVVFAPNPKGGGLVVLLQREEDGKIWIPGGKLNYKETAIQAAIRETYEECGIKIRAELMVQLVNEVVEGFGKTFTFKTILTSATEHPKAHWSPVSDFIQMKVDIGELRFNKLGEIISNVMMKAVSHTPITILGVKKLVIKPLKVLVLFSGTDSVGERLIVARLNMHHPINARR